MNGLLVIAFLLSLSAADDATDVDVCTNGQNGVCGKETGYACQSGTTCILTGESPDKDGKCCTIHKDAAEKSNACTQPVSVGPCKGAFRRYFYNSKKGKCEMFIWGGCNPNANNFQSKKECMNACENVCSLPRAKGSCEDKVNRWYFDSAKCKCKAFSYSGCGGNSNNYASKKDCEKSCRDSVCPLCSELKKVGPCKAAIPRFFFDPKANKCKKFIWGGCKPNGNNFSSLKKCRRTCM